jgi:uncharacterized protein (TIGR02284 family)
MPPVERPPREERHVSTDAKIANQLIHTLENGRIGYEKAAEKLADGDRPEVASKFREFSQQRAAMSDELERIATSYGDETEQRSTVPGALHRGWMAVKDAFTGDDSDAVIAAAETGEDHAVAEYKDALDADLSPEFRPLIARQLVAVQSAHDYVRGLLPSTK